MDFQLIPDFQPRVIECTAGITDARDAMELAYACGDADTELLLIDERALAQEFFDLRTGFAGDFIQRLVNYRLRTAAIFANDGQYPQRFREFLLEARGNPQFRAFNSRHDALTWLAAVAPLT